VKETVDLTNMNGVNTITHYASYGFPQASPIAENKPTTSVEPSFVSQSNPQSSVPVDSYASCLKQRESLNNGCKTFIYVLITIVGLFLCILGNFLGGNAEKKT
jgi:hypothetical protein